MTTVAQLRTRAPRAGIAIIALATIVSGFAGLAASSGPAQADAKRANEIIEGLQLGGATRSLKSNDISGTCNTLIESVAGATRGPTKAEIDTIQTCTEERPALSFSVTFALGSAELDEAAIPVLRELGSALEDQSFADAVFIVAGHTDARGSRNSNLRLSKRRAETVRTYLSTNYRVSGQQLRAIGYGFDNLANESDPYADENRRVEIVRIR